MSAPLKPPKAPSSFPPRVWIVSNEDDGTREYNRLIANFKPWTSVYGKPEEYLSLSEHQSLLSAEREAGRKEAFEEATKEGFYGPWPRRIHIETPYSQNPPARVLKAGEVPSSGCVYIRIGEWVDARKASAKAPAAGKERG